MFKGITFSGHFFEMIIHQLAAGGAAALFFGGRGQSESNVGAAQSFCRGAVPRARHSFLLVGVGGPDLQAESVVSHVAVTVMKDVCDFVFTHSS